MRHRGEWGVRFVFLGIALLALSCTLFLDPLDSRDSGHVDANRPDVDADQASHDADDDMATVQDGDRTDSNDADLDVDRDIDRVDIEEECTPDCEGRACGPDGCGDVCDTCRAGENCTSDGLCIEAVDDCGDAFEECCENRVCHNGLCRANWICAPCGNENNVCCATAPRCAEGLTCFGFGVLAACI